MAYQKVLKNVDIDEEEILRLWLEESWSIGRIIRESDAVIDRITGVRRTKTVVNKLIDSSSKPRKKYNKNRIIPSMDLDEEEIVRLYTEDKLSARQILLETDASIDRITGKRASQDTILRILKDVKIDKKIRDDDYDLEGIKEAYLSGKTLQEIKDSHLGLNKRTGKKIAAKNISKLLKRNGIELRDGKLTGKFDSSVEVDWEHVYELFKSGKSFPELAKTELVGYASETQIRREFKKRGFEVERVRSFLSDYSEETLNMFRELHIKKGVSILSLCSKPEAINPVTGTRITFKAMQDVIGRENLRNGRSSNIENDVCEEIKLKGFNAKSNTRQVIKPQELDVYVPERNLAIEINGSFWHRTEVKGQDYHLNKMLKCEELNILLLQFTEIEIFSKQNFVWSLIDEMLYGCIKEKAEEVKYISEETALSFLQENYTFFRHGKGLKYIGVFQKKELLQLVVLKEESIIYDVKKLNSRKEFIEDIISFIDGNVYYLQDNRFPKRNDLFKNKEFKVIKPKKEWWNFPSMSCSFSEPNETKNWSSVWNSGCRIFTLKTENIVI